MMPKSISFIIPAYNEEKNLGKCLESILTEIDNVGILTEIIIVNNASTDGTKFIALNFNKVRVVDEPKKGLVFARAAGAKVANGELLAHIDADCLLPKGWTNTALKQFESDENLVALSGPHIFYDLPLWKQIVVRLFYSLAVFVAWLNASVFRTGSVLQGGNFVVRKWAWEKMGESASEFNFYGEDTELCRKLFLLGKVKFTFSLPIKTSGRRLAEEGLFVIGTRYALNYFSVLFFKKPVTKKYKDIRPA